MDPSGEWLRSKGGENPEYEVKNQLETGGRKDDSTSLTRRGEKAEAEIFVGGKNKSLEHQAVESFVHLSFHLFNTVYAKPHIQCEGYDKRQDDSPCSQENVRDGRVTNKS